MQIIIVQSEIEEAIRNHILEQVAVKEGMKIDIDLRATRGDQGFQALINIVRDDMQGVGEQIAEPAVEEAPAEKTAPLGIVEKATRARRSPVSTTKTAESVEQTENKAAPEPAQEAAQSEDSATGASVAENTDPAPGEGPVAPKPSLFGNLRKPVNTPATADA